MLVAQPPVSVAGGGDLPMRKKIDILENCCSRPIVKKKNSYIVIPTFSWACLSWRLSQQNRWWPRVIAVRAQQKGVGGFGREEGGQNGVKSFSDGAFLFLLTNVFLRDLLQYYMIFQCEVSSLIQHEMAPYIFLANDTRISLSVVLFFPGTLYWYWFKKITYHQGELQSTFIEFSHDF